MEAKSKLALVVAAGALGLFTVSAYAQQPATPPAEKPAVEAPATAEKSTKTQDGAKTAEADKPEAEKSERKTRRSWRHHRRHSHYGRGGWRRGKGRRSAWRNMSAEDRKAFFEARLAAVYAGLMLNETQAKLWPDVEAAVREMVAKRRARAERLKKEGRLDNPFERMKRRADMMVDRGAAMQKFASAAKPLYDTLSDAQKRRLKILTRGAHRMGRGRGMRRHGMNRGRHHHDRWRGRGHRR